MPQTVNANHTHPPTLQRLLYVEDDPGIQAIVKLALEDIGQFTVNSCSSGSEAIATGVAFIPDLILLDVMMPEMDGPTTLKELRQIPELAATPVIFVTANNNPQEVAYLKEQGAIAVIAKPFNPLTLCDEIKNAWHIQSTVQTPKIPNQVFLEIDPS